MSDTGPRGGEIALADTQPSAIAYRAACSPLEAKEAMSAYTALCEAVLGPEDYQEFQQWDQATRTKVTRRFKKKSAVKKLQTFWNISVSIKETWRDEFPDGHFGFRVLAVASLPNGRVVESVGACTTLEERFDIEQRERESDQDFARRKKRALARAYHDVFTTAETRATNRAVMNCIGVGGGEVTSDEVRQDRQSYDTTERREPEKDSKLVRRIFAICSELKWDEKRRREEMSLLLGKTSIKACSEDELIRFGKHISALRGKDD